jgi:hypothetical protein
MFNTKQRSSCHKCKKREATWAWYLSFQWWNLALHHKSSIVEVRAIDANKIQQLWHIRWHSFKLIVFSPFLFVGTFLNSPFIKKLHQKEFWWEISHKFPGGGGGPTSTLHFIAMAASERLLLSLYVTKGPTLSGHYALGTEGRTRSSCPGLTVRPAALHNVEPKSSFNMTSWT